MHPFIILAQNTQIETERLLLRPMTVDDLRDYHEYSSNASLLRYDYPENKSIEESLASLVAYNLATPLGRYGIELKETGKLIGNMSLRFSDKLDSVEIGYTINPDYHGKGYATEGARALKDLVQQIPEVNSLVANVDSRNLASIHVLEKLGLQLVSEVEKTSLRGEQIVSRRYELLLKT